MSQELHVLTDVMPESRQLVEYLTEKKVVFVPTDIMSNQQAYAYALQIAEQGKALPVTMIAGEEPVFGFNPQAIDKLIEKMK